MTVEQPMQLIMEESLQWARDRNLPLILASTTGNVAREMLRIMGETKIRFIVVTHDPRRLDVKTRFDPEVITKLRESGFYFLEDKAPFLPSLRVTRWLDRNFKISAVRRRERSLKKLHGVGGMVCFQIAERAVKAGLIHAGESVVVLGGSQSGVDTALELKVESVNPVSISLNCIVASLKMESALL